MSKQVCQMFGCTEHTTEHAELEVITADNMEIWTTVHVCPKCDALLSNYFHNDESITIDGCQVESVCVFHATPNAEGFAESLTVGFKFAEEDDVDEFDSINVGLFDKEQLQMVDVESD